MSDHWPQKFSFLRAAFTQLVVIVLLVLSARVAAAHPISVVKSFVFVTREQVNAKLEIFVEDLFLFHNLKPNDRDFLEPDVIRDGIEKHKKFLLERFVIRDVNGQPLAGKVIGIKEFDMKPEGVPLAELMSHKLTFELQYPMAEPPEFLTFSQHLVDEEILVPAEMQLLIKQENAGSPYESVLNPNEPQTVRFSWDNPPLSADASQEQWDDWYAKQREETLGITSYSSVYSFLYINDYQVRHEILVPLLTLEESVLIARVDDAFLDIAEQDAARQQIEAFFTSGNPVEIDGVAVKPVVERVDFYGLDLKDFAKQAERRRVSMANARVGIILSYNTKGPPSSVQVKWDRWNKYIWTINMIIYAYDDTLKATLSRVGMDNVYQWKNPGRPPVPPLQQVDLTLPEPERLSLPIVSLTCLGLLPLMIIILWWRAVSPRKLAITMLAFAVAVAATWPIARVSVASPFAAIPRADDQQAAAIFQSLHKNIYRAFDYRDENEIYDALAKSVDGDLLKDLYLSIRHGLEMQEQGGAVSRVREVKIIDGDREFGAVEGTDDPRAFRYHCRWTVDGTVEHWGHVHARTNQYEAMFAVQPTDNSWKITDMDVLSEERVKFETSLRGL